MRETRSKGKGKQVDAPLPTPPTTATATKKKRGTEAEATPTTKRAKKETKKKANDDDEEFMGDAHLGPEDEEYMDDAHHDPDDIVEQDDGSEASSSEATAGVAKKRRPHRRTIKLERALSSFDGHIGIGRKRPLPVMSAEQEEQCIAEFWARMEFTVRSRKESSASGRKQKIFTAAMQRLLDSLTVQDILDDIDEAVNRERQLVLGGMWSGLFEFTDLPRMTPEELLRRWGVYGDQVGGSHMYGGSGTADPKNDCLWSRLGGYLKFKIRADNGEDVSLETEASAHLSHAKDAEMEIRLLASFDPLKITIGRVLLIEALFIDFLQCCDRDYVASDRNKYHNSEALQASIEASELEDKKWVGCNHCSPFLQGIRGSSLKARVVAAQGCKCPICYHDVPWGQSLWYEIANSTHLGHLELEGYGCSSCYAMSCRWMRLNDTRLSLDDLRERRTGSTSENLTNAQVRRSYGISLAEYKNELAAQQYTCPCCDQVYTDDLQNWSPNMLVETRSDCISMCTPCCHNRRAPVHRDQSEETFVEHRRAFVALRQSLTAGHSDQSALTAGRNARVAGTRQTSFKLLTDQQRMCGLCGKGTGLDIATIKTFEDLTTDVGQAMDLPANNGRPARTVYVHKKCYKDFNSNGITIEQLADPNRVPARDQGRIEKFEMLCKQEWRCGLCNQKPEQWAAITEASDVRGAVVPHVEMEAIGDQPAGTYVCDSSCKNAVAAKKAGRTKCTWNELVAMRRKP